MAEEQIVPKIETGAAEQPGASQVETEITPEKAVEFKVETGIRAAAESAPAPVAPAPVPVRPLPAAKSPQQLREEQIDQILSEGLSDIYLSLSPQKQAEFRQGGEATVKKINILLSQAKVKVKQVLDLIKRWLAIIPGVNKFFLEQEAKIKADKIMKLKK